MKLSFSRTVTATTILTTISFKSLSCHGFMTPPPPLPAAATSSSLPVATIELNPKETLTRTTISPSSKGFDSLTDNFSNFLLASTSNTDTKPSPSSPPTNAEIKLLREAFGAFYGELNPEKAENLLSQAISAWERQPPDEKAALYRVRGDCYMALLKAEEAVNDYKITIDLLTSPGGELADPTELPSALLGRARAMRSLSNQNLITYNPSDYKSIASDYQTSLRLSSREEWDTDEENESDGASRNPYAAWEWGMAKRGSGDYKGAAETHTLASMAFKDIGDRPRSVISALDAGIDLAASASTKEEIDEAKKVLYSAIQSTIAVEGRDVELLQRIIAKESEARMALASILWNTNQRAEAETQFGEACGRLDQLQADADGREKARIKSGAMPVIKAKKLPFTIDDIAGPELSCSRFKNEKFVAESLLWPEGLRQKLFSLNNLKN